MKPIRGLVSAPYTPFDERGDVKLDTIDELAERARADGLAGVFPCGTTGEFPSLTLEERKSVAERWAKVSGDELPVIVHVGSTCLRDSQALASHAQKVGANAIGAIGPYFFRPQTAGSLVDYIAEIAGAAPDLPFYYYHIPLFTGVDVDLVEFLRCAGESIPNFAGVKYTTPRIDEFKACCDLEGGRYEMLWGTDEMLLPAWSMGIHGAVGSTYNIAAPLYRRLLQAAEQGDLHEAQRLQMLSIEMIRTIGKYPFHPAMKHVMRSIGIECGACRMPQPQLSEQEAEALLRELEQIGFYGWAREPLTQTGS